MVPIYIDPCPISSNLGKATYLMMSVLDAITLSGLVLGKQKLDRSSNFNKQDEVEITKFSDQTKCRASEARKNYSLKNQV